MKVSRRTRVTVSLTDLDEMDVEALSIGLQLLIKNAGGDEEDGGDNPMNPEEQAVYERAKNMLGYLADGAVRDYTSPLPSAAGFEGDTMPPPARMAGGAIPPPLAGGSPFKRVEG